MEKKTMASLIFLGIALAALIGAKVERNRQLKKAEEMIPYNQQEALEIIFRGCWF